MKIIEAMKKIKDLEAKAEDLRKKVGDHCADLSFETPLYPDQRAVVDGWLQSHHDIWKEVLELKLAVQRTNLATDVTIELDNVQVTQCIAAWVHRRRTLATAERARILGGTLRQIVCEARAAGEFATRGTELTVGVRVRSLKDVESEGVVALPGVCIDELDISVSNYEHPRPELLRCDDSRIVEESVHSHLLKSNCPVTSQPDWGSVAVEYRGAALDHASLLEYIVSFRQHSDFHEQCVERIFLDLQRLLKPEKLTVYARYVRRGGLDINPYRSTEEVQLPNHRLVRQ